jgi:hypothetical protein
VIEVQEHQHFGVSHAALTVQLNNDRLWEHVMGPDFTADELRSGLLKRVGEP